MAIVTFRVREYKRGLLMHSTGGMRPVEGTKATGKKTIPLPAEEAELGCYRNGDGQLYAPGDWFVGALYGGAKGKGVSVQGRARKVAAREFIGQNLIEWSETCLLYHPDTRNPLTTYELDTRRAVIQRQGIMRTRAYLPEWECEVWFEIDADSLPAILFREFVEAAGKAGIGDNRPSNPSGRPGPFGRFQVLDMSIC